MRNDDKGLIARTETRAALEDNATLAAYLAHIARLRRLRRLPSAAAARAAGWVADDRGR